jgi:hypothetical protein
MIWGSLAGSNLDLAAAIAATLDRYRTAPTRIEAPSSLPARPGSCGGADARHQQSPTKADLSGLVRANREHEAWGSVGLPGTSFAARAWARAEWREKLAAL